MWLNRISLGVYYPGTSLLHRLQARTKLLVMLMLVTTLVVGRRSYWNFIPYFIAFLLAVVAVCCSGISWREMGRRLWLLLVLVVVGMGLGLLSPVGTNYSGRPLYILPPLLLSPLFLNRLALVMGLLILLSLVLVYAPLPVLKWTTFRRVLRRVFWVTLLLIFLLLPLVLPALLSRPAHTSLRLAYMISYDDFWANSIFLAFFLVLYPCSLLITMTTSPLALIEGLTMLMKPLRKLRLPVDDFSLMLLLALRFIPTLVEEVEQLLKAQVARGASFNTGPLRQRVHSMIALFTPFLHNIFRRASELATALEARGYQVDGHQTYLHEKVLTRADYMVLIVVGGSLLVALVV